MQTNREFEEMYLRPLATDDVEREGVMTEKHAMSGAVNYPYTLDWREKGLVSQVRFLTTLSYIIVFHEN